MFFEVDLSIFLADQTFELLVSSLLDKCIPYRSASVCASPHARVALFLVLTKSREAGFTVALMIVDLLYRL